MIGRVQLDDGWTLAASGASVPQHIAGQVVPAQVPGCAHTDLLAAGLIPDPYQDRVEERLVWAHRADWRYSLAFESAPLSEGERADLVFGGIDTVATITLNGRELGRTANMHRSYRFDVRDVLAGRNELTVDLGSALVHAEGVEQALGLREHVYPHPFNMVRKMACSFGWDWGPDLQTAGLWKPVALERWRVARLAQVRPIVTVGEDGTGRVVVHVDVERAVGGADLTVRVHLDGRTVEVGVRPDETSAAVEMAVPEARLWWPSGHGDQPLYPLDVDLRADAEVLGSWQGRIGFRTITVDVEPDALGAPFTFVVNGRRIFAKGANWIPDDHFLTRVTRERLERRVDQAVGAHMMMLRVWGGGIYESDDFYDVCDERGVMVWQDFPFACASYPEEEPLWSEVEAEARENVARLTPHPSLALWNGGNENLWGFADWGWPEQLQGRSWGLRYYTELLPQVVAELDPTRFYCAGSPYSPGADGQPAEGVHPNDQDHGTRHEWEVWNRQDYTRYRDHVPRFCSEFGFQGPPTWRTLTDAVHDDPLTPTSAGFLLHQKAEDGNSKLDRGLEPHLPEPETFDDWHWATQLNQARAVAFGIEHFRSWWPRTAGALVWQLNDCWPVTSWAAVDSGERLKPLWYALRHAFAPRLLTVQPRDGRVVLVAVNESGDPWTGPLRVERQGFDGTCLAATSLDLVVPAWSVVETELDGTLIGPHDAGQELLVALVGDVRVVHPFAEDVDSFLDPGALSADVVAVQGGYRVDIHASSFARDVALLVDRVAPDATVDEMLVPLLAGESRTFLVTTAAELDPAALVDRLVLRSAPGALARVGRG